MDVRFPLMGRPTGSAVPNAALAVGFLAAVLVSVYAAAGPTAAHAVHRPAVPRLATSALGGPRSLGYPTVPRSDSGLPGSRGTVARHASTDDHQDAPRLSGVGSVALLGALIGAALGLRDRAAALFKPAAQGAAALAVTIALAGPMDVAFAKLPGSNLLRDPEAILSNALPSQNRDIYKMEQTIEGLTRVADPVNGVRAAVSSLTATVLDDKVQAGLVASFAPAKKAEGQAAIKAFEDSLQALKQVDGRDKLAVQAAQRKALRAVGQIRAAMVQGFPFEVPAKYAGLPQLRGRATVEGKVRFNKNPNAKEAVFTIVVDGYSAPVTAGNFIDLVTKGFYDGMSIQRSDGFVVQTGDPDGPADGYVQNGQVRRIPFEVKTIQDPVPYYEATLEELGLYNEPVTLPFNSLGTMAMARGDASANSASSQFFWLLKDSELTPIGNNVLDGRYAAFGYIVDNEEFLRDVKVGDEIVYLKVTSGMDQFVPADPKAPPLTLDA